MVRERLKEARDALGLTQEDMATALGYKSKSHYCMIENGQRGVSVEIALAIAKLLERPVEALFDTADVHSLNTGHLAATFEHIG